MAKTKTGANVFWTAAYLCASSLMLILNKLAVTAFPHNGVLLLQVIVTLFIVVTTRDSFFALFDLQKIAGWSGVAIAFGMPLFTNMRALSSMSVETTIVFRALSTLVVAVVEHTLMGEQFSLQSIAALLVIFSGSAMYSYNDVSFDPKGYFWGLAYCLSLVFNGTYIKHMFSKHHSMSDAEKTYLNNLVILPVNACLMFVEESRTLWMDRLQNATHFGIASLIGSCVLGTAVSYTGTVLRSRISATAFNVAGNANKFFTVLLSMVFVERNIYKQQKVAITGLFLVLSGALWYALESQRKRSVSTVPNPGKEHVKAN